MDYAERLHAAEMEALRLANQQAKHEEICAMRYEAIKGGMDRMGGYMKWLAISVAALALVTLGIATVDDMVRSAAARIGVSIQQPAR